jgi:hypothetical protein
MVVLSNRRLGPSAELMVSEQVATKLLGEIASSARGFAEARWELELVRWLEWRAQLPAQVLDVSEIAWTPDHFERQRQFVLDALTRAQQTSDHAAVLERWRHLIEAHPRDSVVFGRRWQWEVTA